MKYEKIMSILGVVLIFTYLLFFPLGTMLSRQIEISGGVANIHITDLIVAISIPLVIFGKLQKPGYYRKLLDFFYVAIASNILALAFIPANYALFGSFYLVRLYSFVCLSVIVWNAIKYFPGIKAYFTKILISIPILISLLGWLQYFLFFDMRFLEKLGWDKHYGRITAPFLDPTYTGLILLLGLIFVYVTYLKTKSRLLIPALLLILITILFTYSRATILALLIVSLIEGFKKLSKKGILFAIIILSSLFFLPRIASEGTRLERTASIFQRLENYNQTFLIIRQNPIFGVGFNNLCFMRKQLFGGGASSHACSGSDSSILYVFATTGLVGLFVLMASGLYIYRNLEKNIYSDIFKLIILTVFVHSFFANSFFYSWVMGLIAIILPLSYKKKLKKE